MNQQKSLIHHYYVGLCLMLKLISETKQEIQKCDMPIFETNLQIQLEEQVKIKIYLEHMLNALMLYQDEKFGNM